MNNPPMKTFEKMSIKLVLYFFSLDLERKWITYTYDMSFFRAMFLPFTRMSLSIF